MAPNNKEVSLIYTVANDDSLISKNHAHRGKEPFHVGNTCDNFVVGHAISSKLYKSAIRRFSSTCDAVILYNYVSTFTHDVIQHKQL